MCKKFLSGLMGGKQKEPEKPATPITETGRDRTNESTVKTVSSDPNVPRSISASAEERRKRTSVPGLAL